jgi:predicted O-methyltransferase YrrM
VEFEEVAAAVRGVPFMRPDQGRRIYEHVRAERPREILELGTAHGVSAAYMAAALDANGEGHLTTVDSVRGAAHYKPDPVIERAGVGHLITIVRTDDSSYDWWLKEQVESRSDEQGNCRPRYDFCYLDGAHDWTIDGLAALLVEKLLNPGGWLLLDDLDWTYATGMPEPDERMSHAERTQPHVRAIFDLLIKQHPSFTDLRIEDEEWGWARKDPDAPRRLSIETTRSAGAYLTIALRRAVQRARLIRAARSGRG